MRQISQDTIVALATPAGESAIGIVRLSGPRAISIGGCCFRGAQRLEELEDRRLTLGRFVVGDQDLDQILVSVMRGPRTYTGEDVVEFNCHGGPLVVRRALEALVRVGARLADRGEFTKRAFLNGRLDLTQAEAVCSIIRSRSEAQQRAALRLLDGGLAGRVRETRAALRDLCARVEAGIDFSDQDIEIVSAKALADALDRARTDVAEIARGGRSTDVREEAVRVVLCGPVNAGKSSLFNALIGEDRVIVTAVPGTTRDTVEAGVAIGGVRVRLTDTAGTRSPEDAVERSAQERARSQTTHADIVVLVLDGSRRLDAEEAEMVRPLDPARSLVVLNKSDLGREIPDTAIAQLRPALRAAVLSARTGAGVEELRERLAGMVWEGGLDLSAAGLALNARHRQALQRAASALDAATRSAREGMSAEFVALDLRDALDALGEIVGETATEDILDRIFAAFCIGK